MTVREALAEATLYILRRDAELLMAQTVGRSRTWVLSYPESTLAQDLSQAFAALVRRRDAGEPLQYLLGKQEFFGLPLRITPDVLIPRPETEHLVEAVLAHFADKENAFDDSNDSNNSEDRPALRLADVGTGSGAIALALASRLPHADIAALDISRAALAVAKENAERLDLSGRIRFLYSDLLADLRRETTSGRCLHAVVSNPPYVALADTASMQREVVEHEPHVALFAGADGLEVYRRLIPQAHAALCSGGLLAMELGFGQSHALAALLHSGWNSVRFERDYAGIERVVLAIKAESSSR